MTLPDAKILETTVTPNADGAVVRLQIADGSLDSASYSILLDCGFPSGYSGRLLAIRHDGFGWLGFQLPDERARALSMALTNEQSPPTQPAGKLI